MESFADDTHKTPTLDDAPERELTCFDLFDLPAPAPFKLAVPGWGNVYIKTLNVAERAAVERKAFDKKGNASLGDMRIEIVVRATVMKNGAQFFGSDEKTAQQLRKLPAKQVSLIAEKAMELCGMTESDVDNEAEGFGEARGDGGSSA